MKNYKLILYAIYFILMDTNQMSFNEITGYKNLFYFISLIFVGLSIAQDLYGLSKRFKNK